MVKSLRSTVLPILRHLATHSDPGGISGTPFFSARLTARGLRGPFPAQGFKQHESSAAENSAIVVEKDSDTWMSQEVSKWLVNGL